MQKSNQENSIFDSLLWKSLPLPLFSPLPHSISRSAAIKLKEIIIQCLFHFFFFLFFLFPIHIFVPHSIARSARCSVGCASLCAAPEQVSFFPVASPLPVSAPIQAHPHPLLALSYLRNQPQPPNDHRRYSNPTSTIHRSILTGSTQSISPSQYAHPHAEHPQRAALVPCRPPRLLLSHLRHRIRAEEECGQGTVTTVTQYEKNTVTSSCTVFWPYSLCPYRNPSPSGSRQDRAVDARHYPTQGTVRQSIPTVPQDYSICTFPSTPNRKWPILRPPC